jgi:hypothetical protein
MTTISPLRRLAIVVFLVLAAPLTAANEPLLGLVPEGAGFCLVIRDLRDHTAALRESPALAQLAVSPLGLRILAAPELKKLSVVSGQIQQTLGVDGERLRDDIFGDGVVLVYFPGPPNQPEKEQGLLLLRARDPKLLADVCARWDQTQKDSGAVKELSTREHAGAKYWRRVEDKGENFYYLNGPLLAVTSREPLLRRVIERDRRGDGDKPSELGTALTRLDGDGALAVQLINPRAFDAALQAKIAGTSGPSAVALKTWQSYWKAIDGLALSLSIARDGIELRLSISGRPADMPPGARRFLKSASQPSALWQRAPDATLLAVASRIDLAALAEIASDFLPAEGRKEVRGTLDRMAGAALGRDVVAEVLPRLGPDWGLCVLAPRAADRDPLPQGVWALSISNEDGKDDLGPALLGVLNTVAMLAVISNNNSQPAGERLTLKTVVQDGITVKFVTKSNNEPGPRPAFAIKDGYLVLATSPEALQRFTAGTTTTASNDVRLVHVGLRELRQYLKERRSALIGLAAAAQRVAPEEMERRLDNLHAGLDWLKQLDLIQRSETGRVTFLLRLQTERPMRK